MTARTSLFIVLSLLIAFSQTACLKTRAQIKGDDPGDEMASDEAKPKTGVSYQIEELRNEMTRLNGRLEEIDHTQRGQNVGDLRETMTKLDGRVAELEKNQVLVMTEIKALKDKSEAQEAAAREAAVPVSKVLAEAYQLLNQKKFEDAAEKFGGAIRRNAKGKDAADAYFGLGEAEFGLKHYKKAIVNYSKVQESSAKSGHIPASLYKMGLSFQQLNMNKEAKGFFAELADKYPKSPEAKKARLASGKSTKHQQASE